MFNENRRKHSEHGSLPLQIVTLLILGTSFALTYVWLDMKGEALGSRIKNLEKEQVQLQSRLDNEVWKWETTISPSNIEAALKKNNIEMVWPDEKNIVRVRKIDSSVASLQNLAGEIAQLAQAGKVMAND